MFTPSFALYVQIQEKINICNQESEKWCKVWTENALNEAETLGQKYVPESFCVFSSQEAVSIGIFYRFQIYLIE